MFPDLIDKPILIAGLGAGRGISHSLLFIAISFVVLHLIIKGDTSVSVSFLVGCIFHLILDLPGVPFFYPFVSYDFLYTKKPVETWTYTLFHNPLVYTTEIIGLCILVLILVYNKLYTIPALINYLKTNSFSDTED